MLRCDTLRLWRGTAVRLLGVAVALPDLHRTFQPIGDVHGFDLRLCNRILGMGAPVG